MISTLEPGPGRIQTSAFHGLSHCRCAYHISYMYAPSLKLAFSHLKKTGWLEYRNTSFLLVPGPRSGAKMLVSSTMQRANNFPESFFPNQQHFLLILVFGFVFKVCKPMGMSGPGPTLLIRWEPLPTAANASGGATPIFEKDPLIQVLHLHSAYSWTFQFGCLTWFRFRLSIHHPLGFKLAYLGRSCYRKFHALPYFKHVWRVTIIPESCILYTLQGINISHLGKRKIIFKMPFLEDMLVPWRVYSIRHSQEQCSTTTCAIPKTARSQS